MEFGTYQLYVKYNKLCRICLILSILAPQTQVLTGITEQRWYGKNSPAFRCPGMTLKIPTDSNSELKGIISIRRRILLLLL